jgi:aldose 1-epimerase
MVARAEHRSGDAAAADRAPGGSGLASRAAGGSNRAMDRLTIAGAGWQAALAPGDGGGMTALRFEDRDILVPAPEGARLGGPFGAFWMLPWANRLADGRLGPHRLPVNRPQDGTAIHGLSRDRAWQVADLAAEGAILTQAADAPPYRYAARLATAIGAEGLILTLALTNTGDDPMPFGAGWHPWFVRPHGTRIAFRATHRCTHDPRGLPVAAAPCAGLEGGEEAVLGLDTHFAGWDGVARIAWPGLALTIAATGALATNLQVYAPRERDVLCVEPSSHLPDVANRPALAGLGPMRVLAPGEILTGRIVLAAECSHLAEAGA